MKLHIYALLTLLICLAAEAQVPSRPATYAEVELIRDVFRLDDLPEWRRQYEALSVEGTFRPPSETSGATLSGRAYMAPYEVQGSLCVMEVWFVSGRWKINAYEWTSYETAYWNWLRDPQGDCRILNRSAVPEDAVETRAAIPSASLPIILSNAAEILALAFDYTTRSTEMEAADKTRFLKFRDEPAYRLSEIRLSMESQPGIGFVYHATYRSPGESEGPTVMFSVTPAGIVVHGVGSWIA